MRKDPKKKTFPDSVESTDSTGKEPKGGGKPKGKPKGRVDKQKGGERESEDVVEITARESDNEFPESSEKDSDSGNTSSNARPVNTSESERDTEEKDSDDKEADIQGQVNCHVDAALEKYFRKRKVKKRGRKKRRRRDETSSSDSESDSSSSSEDENSDSEGSSTDRSRRHRESRKRKRKEKKRRNKKSKKGKSPVHHLEESISKSTIYTHGCKSPQRAIMADSSDQSLDGGDIRSDANTEDFIESLNTSRERNRSTPDLGRGPERERRTEREGHGDASRDQRMYDGRYQEQADAVIRDLHQNKADLAKPSGELFQYILSSLA